ncbi:MAG: type II secretion system protein [Patescibacteria group bacterium]
MRGFTLVEALLSLAIIAIITGLSAPVYFSYSVKNDFSLAVDAGVRSLRRAQFLALNNDRDSNWGTYFSTSSITLYNGNNYDARNSGFDEVYLLPGVISSTVADINFTKFSGEPASFASTTIRSSYGDINVIDVNIKGFVDY